MPDVTDEPKQPTGDTVPQSEEAAERVEDQVQEGVDEVREDQGEVNAPVEPNKPE